MRTAPTPAEQKLWERLRNRRLCGAKFRRQHPIGAYIVDFYCHEAKLIVELDGSSHLGADQAEYDRTRSNELRSIGMRVLRFWNHEILNYIEQVVEAITAALLDPHPDPLPEGEGV